MMESSDNIKNRGTLDLADRKCPAAGGNLITASQCIEWTLVPKRNKEICPENCSHRACDICVLHATVDETSFYGGRCAIHLKNSETRKRKSWKASQRIAFLVNGKKEVQSKPDGTSIWGEDVYERASEVYELVKSGKTQRAVANELGISESMVNKYTYFFTVLCVEAQELVKSGKWGMQYVSKLSIFEKEKQVSLVEKLLRGEGDEVEAEIKKAKGACAKMAGREKQAKFKRNFWQRKTKYVGIF